MLSSESPVLKSSSEWELQPLRNRTAAESYNWTFGETKGVEEVQSVFTRSLEKAEAAVATQGRCPRSGEPTAQGKGLTGPGAREHSVLPRAQLPVVARCQDEGSLSFHLQSKHFPVPSTVAEIEFFHVT